MMSESLNVLSSYLYIYIYTHTLTYNLICYILIKCYIVLQLYRINLRINYNIVIVCKILVQNRSQTRQSEMADLARRATRWVGTFPYILTPIPNLYDHSFPRYGQITFLAFRRPTTLTFDLKFWKYLSVTVYPYVICMPSFIMIGWEMAEILHFEILRKHGQTNTHTNKHTNKQTWALQYLALPLWGAR